MEAETPSYKGFRFPAEIISHCVWLYHRFPLSFREVEEMMLRRGVIVSHETIRQWCAKFGQTYANGLRRRRARPGDKWHLVLQPQAGMFDALSLVVVRTGAGLVASSPV